MFRPNFDSLSTWKQGAGASYLGLFFVTVVAMGGLGGNWIDHRYHTSPFGAAIGVFLGCAAGIREMLKVLGRQRNTTKPTQPSKIDNTG